MITLNQITWTVAVAAVMACSVLQAEEIGSVDTKFKFLTPDHSIVVEAFEDPEITGITCYLSRAKKGGIRGALGIAEETSDASIDCRQVGPIQVKGELDDGDKVFKERRSLIFKKLQVIRFVDEERNAIVYLAYSDRLIEGSPHNSISAVPLMPWPKGETPRVPQQSE